MEESSEPICQSCAMPLAADPKGGGSEENGSLSPDYCSYCYADGAFTAPGVSMDQFVERLKGIMAGANVPESDAYQALATLPRLKRWARD